jgi:hypothetical protein
MRNYLRKISALVVLVISVVSCNPSDPAVVASVPPPLFTNSNTSMQQLYNQLASATGGYYKSYNDYEEQSYDFEMSTNGTIYSFGYSSQPLVANKNYKIELLNASGAVISAVTTTFLTTGSYYTLPTPVAILANTKYTFRRTFYITDATPVTATTGGFSDIIGPGLKRNGLPLLTLPAVVGNMKITGTSCRQVTSTSTPPIYSSTALLFNTFIPFIDFAFTPN